MNRIDLKQNDTGVGAEIQLSNFYGPIDLTGSTPWFLFDDKQITASIVNAANGDLLVVFNKYATQKAGEFNGEIEVEFSDGRIETFPNNGYVKVVIHEEVGGR